ncbi:MAG: PilZ domain-containing protein [Pseudomonadota bacterium]
MAKKAVKTAKKTKPETVGARWRKLLAEENKQINKRNFPREASYTFARLGVEANVEVDCVVRDVSDGGVRIKMEEARPLPRAVRLTFVESGQTKLCRVAWQKSKHAGLEYLNQKRKAYQGLDD